MNLQPPPSKKQLAGPPGVPVPKTTILASLAPDLGQGSGEPLDEDAV